jgi:hypothetical protein
MFHVETGKTDTLELQLVSVSGYGKSMGGSREAYSLLFCGPLMPVLQQQIYRISKVKAMELDVFLVPIGPHADGMGYEAVFT